MKNGKIKYQVYSSIISCLIVFAFIYGLYNLDTIPKDKDVQSTKNIIRDALDDVIEQQIDDLISQMTLDEKCEQLYGSGMFDTADNTRLGIPGFKMSDGPHGVRGTYGQATSFPVGIAMASTWDPSLIEEVGWAMGREFLAKGRNQALGPCVDITRDPRNGRSAESSGEEPYLGGIIGASVVNGLQSTQVIATVKHYTAVSHQTDRENLNVNMDERTLIELYSLPFRLSIQQGGALSVMNAFNWINGVPCSEDSYLLTEILREKFAYDYYVVSDWWSVYNGAENSINAGCDVDMPGDVYSVELQSAVESGTVSMDTLELAVRRVLRTKITAGLLNNFPEGDPNDIYSQEHIDINLEAAQKSIVLLKNEEKILPLEQESLNSIALVGPSADVCQLDGFGSSEVDPTYTVTPRQGINNMAPNVLVNYAKGCDINSQDTSGFQTAIEYAANSDIVIFVGGLDRTQEGEGYDIGGDRKSGSVQLPGMQQDLINELANVNPNVIVVLESGGICAVQNCIENIKGFLYAFYLGQEGGNAIADILFGNVNPGGKLPVTIPKDDSQLPEWDDLDFTGDIVDGFGYRRFDSLGLEPEYAFGHGLSYTEFTFGNLQYNSSALGDSQIEVSVDISNIGQRAGDEVVQLYLTPQDARVPMPLKQLRGFERISLNPGETQTVTLILGAEELSYWSESLDCFYIEQGTFNFQIGNSSDSLPLSGSFEITSNYEYRFTSNVPNDQDPPAEPTGLSATVVSSSGISLNWNANIEPDLTNYRIYRSTSESGTYRYISQTGMNSYSDSGLVPNTQYYYKITAVDTSNNESPQTSQVSAMTFEGGSDTFLRAQYYCGEISEITEQMRPMFMIHNDGTTDVALTDIRIRYWLTSEPILSSLSNSIDFAAVGSSEITSEFGNAGDSDYLEIGFTSSASIPTWMGGDGTSNFFPVGAYTGDIQNRIGTTSSTNFDQTNDYSFNPDFLSYADSSLITVYHQHILVWGVEPTIEPNEPPVISQPSDISYNIGDIGNIISWVATDTDSSIYSISIDGSLVSSGDWQSNIPIELNVDGLLFGNHTVSITVEDEIGLVTTDNVIITIYEGSIYELGDVNHDEAINIVDALLVAQYYVGESVDIDETLADVNLDGTISIVDALLIAQFYVGKIDFLPPL